ncbi:replication-associated recombination protein A [Thermodesulfobacteriota bacterium]
MARDDETQDLFEGAPGSATEPEAPLADRMRPRSLDEFIGQEEILREGSPLREAVEADKPFSFLLWGPPGCGKTALANVIRSSTCHNFVALSAVLSGLKDVREVIRAAGIERSRHQRKTILFVDEIHRFNKSQQDAFLPHVEKGTVILIGATTENPSFEVNAALLSRTKVFAMKCLTDNQVERIVRNAVEDRSRGLGKTRIRFEPGAIEDICAFAQGDARVALNTLEIAVELAGDETGETAVSRKMVGDALQKAPLYDKAGEEHYNIISAFIKSLRGSDPDAALYWLARMIEAGEDPLFVARRLVIFASEDVGNADPQAIQVAVAAKDAVHFIGMPEAKLPLAQATTYLATAPKSNASYTAYLAAGGDARELGPLPAPLHLRNAPTKLMRELDYAKGYLYPHDDPDAIVSQRYFPDGMPDRIYYEPMNRGHERTIKERLDKWKALKKELREANRKK